MKGRAWGWIWGPGGSGLWLPTLLLSLGCLRARLEGLGWLRAGLQAPSLLIRKSSGLLSNIRTPSPQARKIYVDERLSWLEKNTWFETVGSGTSSVKPQRRKGRQQGKAMGGDIVQRLGGWGVATGGECGADDGSRCQSSSFLAPWLSGSVCPSLHLAPPRPPTSAWSRSLRALLQ